MVLKDFFFLAARPIFVLASDGQTIIIMLLILLMSMPIPMLALALILMILATIFWLVLR